MERWIEEAAEEIVDSILAGVHDAIKKAGGKCVETRPRTEVYNNTAAIIHRCAPTQTGRGDTCEWRPSENTEGVRVAGLWHTGCGAEYTTAKPHAFCQFCGKYIIMKGEQWTL